MYQKTSRISIPTDVWLTVTKKITRTRLKTILDKAAKANQIDNWNCGDTTEGDTLFDPHSMNERLLWQAIRDENKKLFQRSLAGKK
ncbi:MAG: hypothetical protein J6S67_23220 [Methanobrevibacter sp.]|nr:hypothetical protein [Methanobrevibacter sp.]